MNPERTQRFHLTDLQLIIIASIFIGLASGLYHTTFNNFLDDVYHIDAATRGWLELPRELPGLLVALFTGLLFFLSDTRMAALAMGIMGVGFIGLSVLPELFGVAVLWLFLMSIGQHIHQPLEHAIGVSVASKNREGARLGQITAARTAATVLAAGLVWVLFDYLDLFYDTIFILSAIGAFVAALIFLAIRGARETRAPDQEPVQKIQFTYQKKFTLFYILSFLFGARKQVLLTFGPWVLVRVFNQPPSIIARLWMVASLLGIVFNPLLGRLIDRIGERAVLIGDGAMVTLICLGYGYGGAFGGIWVVYGCFVLDQLLMTTGMARSTYVNRLADDRSELTPTLSLGVSINHAVSMSIPVLGGLIWSIYGYQWVFLMFGLLSVLTVVAAGQIHLPQRPVVTAEYGETSS